MNENSAPTYAKTNKGSSPLNGFGPRSYQKGSLSLWKLFFLGVFALALSTVPILGLFAAMPLVMGTLLYGRVPSYAMSAVLSFALLVLAQGGFFSAAANEMLLAQFSLITFSAVVSVLVSEIILRKIQPAQGLFRVGGVMALVFLFGFGAYMAVNGLDQIREYANVLVVEQFEAIKAQEQYKSIVKEGNEEASSLEAFLSAPKELSDWLVTWVPGVAAMVIFIACWMTLFLVLKNSLVWRTRFDYPYALDDLIKFRLPEQIVWVLILGLGLTLAGSSMENFLLSMVGFNILYALGVLYFFQGFGIYLDFLNHLKIFGFLRPLLVIFTVFMAARVIALVGVFDMWANFRRFLTHKNDHEGDIK